MLPYASRKTHHIRGWVGREGGTPPLLCMTADEREMPIPIRKVCSG